MSFKMHVVTDLHHSCFCRSLKNRVVPIQNSRSLTTNIALVLLHATPISEYSPRTTISWANLTLSCRVLLTNKNTSLDEYRSESINRI